MVKDATGRSADKMRRNHAVLLLAVSLLGATAALGQEKTEMEKAPTPLTVQVIFSEFEGDKKISNLPYTMPVNADDRRNPGFNQLRMGVRVPITTASQEGMATQFQYMDVGTNIDCRARRMENNQFEVEVTVERNSIYSAGDPPGGKPVEWNPNDRIQVSSRPIVRHYRSTMTLLMRDGQTIQRSIATDPLSGRVLKVDVTLNVVK